MEKFVGRVNDWATMIASLLDPSDFNMPNCSSDDSGLFDPPAARDFLARMSLDVSTLCCLIGMGAPRTSLVMSSLGLLYFLTCLFVLVSLIRNLFGSRDSFSTTLKYDQKEINFQSPPFCCCCFFLPKANSNTKNLRRIEWLVLQAPIVRALIVTFNIIAVSEFREDAQQYVHMGEMVAIGSLLLAVFGVHTMARLTSDKLSHYGFMTIFRIVDIALLFFTAQQPLLFENILIRFGVFRCGPMLSAQDNARFICNFVIICEMLLLSWIATIFVSPPRSALFDRYRNTESQLAAHLTEDTMLSTDDESA
ncbi:Organic solute transporter alpha-like protein 3 [Toxocara canis]|uniref:Organic solute transporter alpha-like protein 3 n=1 Tax=Toxocara canis TaxID=6265 RepID=A0A0B2UWS8_TOXCA|nr:Organic solute transporter alpha-like protein 3 [Toxocara canis]